jgi:hypothetical protein
MASTEERRLAMTTISGEFSDEFYLKLALG